MKNMKEYEEICRYIGFGTPIFISAKIPRPGPRGSFTIREYSPRLMTSHLGISCCGKYEGICGKYERICQKYEGV